MAEELVQLAGAGPEKGTYISLTTVRNFQELVAGNARRESAASNEIQEQVNQDLAALQFKVAHLLKAFESDPHPRVSGLLAEINGDLAAVIAELRAISYTLDQNSEAHARLGEGLALLGPHATGELDVPSL